MHEKQSILHFMENHSSHNLVLCTLVAKMGAGYRSTGAMKVICTSGPHQGQSSGLLSGGCLEADIIKTAIEGFPRLPFLHEFSTEADDDRLFGFQLGCAGRLRILFERVEASFDPFLYFCHDPRGEHPNIGGVRLGVDSSNFGTRSPIDCHDMKSGNFDKKFFVLEKTRSPRLCLFGAGPDATSFIELAETSLGYPTEVFDYRSQYLKDLASKGTITHLINWEDPLNSVQFDQYLAIVLMTHNFEADLNLLKALILRNQDSPIAIGYLGCLGPRSRYDQLCADLKKLYGCEIPESWEPKVFAPAGLFSRSHSPSEIALSIISQIQQIIVEFPRWKKGAWTLIPGAGQSKRFGANKALAPLSQDKSADTLLSRTILLAHNLTPGQSCLVTGGHHKEISTYLDQFQLANKVTLVYNEQWANGMGASLSVGCQRILLLDPNSRATLILPMDHPFMSEAHLERLLKLCFEHDKCVMTLSEDHYGPPACIPRRYFSYLQSLAGDRGLKTLIPESELILIKNDRSGRDIDTPIEMQKMLIEP